MVASMSSRSVGADYSGDDFYCDVAIPRARMLEVEYEDDFVLAFHHTKPHWQEHLVVVPKRHVASLTTVGAGDADLMRRLFVVVQDLARDVENRHSAASVVTNLGRYQDSKHLHIHIHSGGRLP
jgi:histidine triad (HIT) family protein